MASIVKDLEDSQAREAKLSEQIANLLRLVTNLTAVTTSHTTQLTDAAQGITTVDARSPRYPKLPDPPTYNGSDNKGDLESWLNQVVLFCLAQGIVVDKLRIVTALTHLRGPAEKYMMSYFDKNTKGEDLGSWTDFVDQLKGIYGKKDDKQGAKEEITKLWTKNLAEKDFIKYTEQYRTLARIVEYEDIIHLDKLRAVIPQDMCQSLVGYELANEDNPATKWEDYLTILLKMWKSLHPEKSASSIFNNSKEGKGKGKDTGKGSGSGSMGNGGSSSGEVPMDVDHANVPSQPAQSKKPKHHCNYCEQNGHTAAMDTHNTARCFRKQRAEREQASGSNTASNRKKNASPSGARPSHKAQLNALLASWDDEDEPQSPSANIASISTPRISAPTTTGATASIDEASVGSSTYALPKITRGIEVDFPEGL